MALKTWALQDSLGHGLQHGCGTERTPGDVDKTLTIASSKAQEAQEAPIPSFLLGIKRPVPRIVTGTIGTFALLAIETGPRERAEAESSRCLEDPLGSTPFLNSRSAPSGLRVPCAWHSGNHVSLSNAAHTETCEEERERESERERKRERERETKTQRDKNRERERERATQK